MTAPTHSVTHNTFVIERTFVASPARVFRAFADLGAKKAWFHGPPGWDDAHAMDFRVGGRETSVGGPPGEWVSSFTALYQDIVPDQRIVYTYDMLIDGRRISVSVATIELFPTAQGGTRLVLTEQGAYLDAADNPAQREEGTRGLMDQLVAAVDGAR